MCVHIIELHTIHYYTVQLWMVYIDSIVNYPMRLVQNIDTYYFFYFEIPLACLCHLVFPSAPPSSTLKQCQCMEVMASSQEEEQEDDIYSSHRIIYSISIFTFVYLLATLSLCCCRVEICWPLEKMWINRKKGQLTQHSANLLLSLRQYQLDGGRFNNVRLRNMNSVNCHRLKQIMLTCM